jgi:putative nucleotidyltransferase with HDIG domain
MNLHFREPYYHTRVSAVITLVNVLMPLRDPYSNGHEKRVASMVKAICVMMGLNSDYTDQTEYAAQLHDLGKLMIAENVLNKPKLTQAERNMVNSHSALGAKAIKALELDQEIVDVINHHHENWNGSGYPDNLAGQDIPLGARIIRIADTFDAMTSDRPYRKMFSQKEAISEMELEVGTSFDPMIFEIFKGMMVCWGSLEPCCR